MTFGAKDYSFFKLSVTVRTNHDYLFAATAWGNASRVSTLYIGLKIHIMYRVEA